MRNRWLVLAAVTLSSWLVVRALAEDGITPLPEPVFSKLVEGEAAFLKKALAKGKVTDKVERKVKAVALMIAAYAQNNMGKANAAEMATLRDTALKLIKAVEAKQMPEAKKLAGMLSGKIKADSAVKTAPVPLHSQLKFEYLMRQFSGEAIGGFALERDLESLVEQKGPLDAGQQAKALALAYKIAVISQLAQAYPAPKNGKTKEWLAFGRNTRAAALDLANAVRSGQNVGGAADKLSLSCTKCHDVFKIPNN
jgi:hypothetical protein